MADSHQSPDRHRPGGRPGSSGGLQEESGGFSPRIPGGEGRDPVWDLLGQAPEVEVRPGFARDLARQARLSSAERPSALATLFGKVRDAFTSAPPAAIGLAATATAAAVAVALVVLNSGSGSGSAGIATVTPPSVPPSADSPSPSPPAPAPTFPEAAPVIGVATFTPEEIDGLTADVNVPAGTVDAMAEVEELNSLLAISDVMMLDDAELAALLF